MPEVSVRLRQRSILTSEINFNADIVIPGSLKLPVTSYEFSAEVFPGRDILGAVGTNETHNSQLHIKENVLFEASLDAISHMSNQP